MQSYAGAFLEAGGLEHDCCPFGEPHHFSLLALQQFREAVEHFSRECRALEFNCSSMVQWLQNCSLWMICSSGIKATEE